MDKNNKQEAGESALIKITDKLLERNSLNRRLHWTTIASEKVLLAVIGVLTLVACLQALMEMYANAKVGLPDLFLLFIYAEIIGMIGAFYSTSRIPVTLPISLPLLLFAGLLLCRAKTRRL